VSLQQYDNLILIVISASLITKVGDIMASEDDMTYVKHLSSVKGRQAHEYT